MNINPNTAEELNDSMKASLFTKALQKIMREDDTIKEQNRLCFQLFQKICEFSTEEIASSGMHFATLFSRIAYLGEVYKMPGQFLYTLHSYRRQVERNEHRFSDEEAIALGKYCIENLIKVIFEGGKAESLPEEAGFSSKIHLRKQNKERSHFRKHLRAYLFKAEKGKPIELVIDDAQSDKKQLLYDENTQNEGIAELIHYFIQNPDNLPATLSLINVSVNDDGTLMPQALVWEPDYLIDVTAISECFSGNSVEPIRYMFHKFIDAENNPYILAGNISNYFLDQLLLNPQRTFNDMLIESFKHNPLSFTAMDERDMDTCFRRVKAAYYVLREVVQKEFKELGIVHKKRGKTAGNNKIEPSFIAPPYGIQGRLDLLYIDAENINIVELKSGSPFMPNAYGLGMNHYVQTLLYNVLIDYALRKYRSQSGSRRTTRAHILYARQNSSPLRYAPEVTAQQMEALLVRNRLMMIEKHLQQLNDRSENSFFDRMNVRAQGHLMGFDIKNVEDFEEMWSRLDAIEKSYIKAFTGFIAREHRAAKIGAAGQQSRPGMSGLWLLSNLEKTQEFNLLESLKLVSDESGDENPLITLRRTERTYPLANFRTGDIVVLYPESDIASEGIHSEIYKSTIIIIDNTYVQLRLRARQSDESPFTLNSLWNIEHDLLESSFMKQYRNLFKWGNIAPHTRQLILGRRAPRKTEENEKIILDRNEFVPALSNEQFALLDKMLHAQEYFLLWGPPGTGKTSFMLKSYVQALNEHTSESIILFAYTNRAVDEICKAIESINPSYHEKYIRIGSSYSTGEEYKDRLLQNIIDSISSRKELKKVLGGYRIYVSTIASFTHKQELLSIKTFDRAFIDEASQLLDPMVVPVFKSIPRIVLMGDHKQLPAVSTQSDEEAIIKNEVLTEIGFESTKISIFERLFKRARNQGWDWAYGRLRAQGRMHETIMQFPTAWFYENELDVIAAERQKSTLEAFYPEAEDSILFRSRLIYVPTAVDKLNGQESLRYSFEKNHKVNYNEALVVAELVERLVDEKYKDNLEGIRSGIGVITPYRAQIAQIRSLIEKRFPEYLDYLTIDTVERYQGGARDIIIISFCTQNELLFQLFSNVDVSGINRKLNVAITRAREQLILVGNQEILESNDIYKQLIEQGDRMEI